MNGKQANTVSVWTRRPPTFVPLTPLSFLKRTAVIYPSHLSAVYEGRAFTWSQTYSRCGVLRRSSQAEISPTAIRSRRCCRTSRR